MSKGQFLFHLPFMRYFSFMSSNAVTYRRLVSILKHDTAEVVVNQGGTQDTVVLALVRKFKNQITT